MQTIVVPIGGGGLISGIAAAVKQLAPHVRIIGVQAENAAAYPPRSRRGRCARCARRRRSPTASRSAPRAASRSRSCATSSTRSSPCRDDETASALLVLLERAKLVVEPAGAVGIAALLSGRSRIPGRTVAVLSGGNIDPLMMERVISRGLVASDRYMTLRIGLPDRPGQLAVISALIAEANANVVEVLHTRHGTGTQISEVRSTSASRPAASRTRPPCCPASRRPATARGSSPPEVHVEGVPAARAPQELRHDAGTRDGAVVSRRRFAPRPGSRVLSRTRRAPRRPA